MRSTVQFRVDMLFRVMCSTMQVYAVQWSYVQYTKFEACRN